MNLEIKKKLKNELKQIINLEIKVENIKTHFYDNQIPKGIKVYNLGCSIMFVDIRNSTEMTDENGRKNMIKIYKMFAKLVITAVEENGGRVYQIMGDGMLCSFISDDHKNSGEKALNAARDINEYLNDVYNKIVEHSWEISCGIGIRTGHIFLNRIGTRGKNKTCKVAYPSTITNYACKLCNQAEGGQVLIDDVTYKQIKTKDMLKKIDKDKLGTCKNIDGDVWGIKYGK